MAHESVVRIAWYDCVPVRNDWCLGWRLYGAEVTLYNVVSKMSNLGSFVQKPSTDPNIPLFILIKIQ
jgi:hypothetical protein